ncbi:cysteine desulfurase family protein [Geminicoccus flavidas]|uniref:cysteine desulfurase family protein n=1 Tax=Geminicoccus flavidas TaxID=2506407 RepID=UPI0013577B49|nr:cysteine desulfurase family protein [Geminicoccus flavidas]
MRPSGPGARAASGRVYLDHAATTPVRPEVVARMAQVIASVGNPSSVHGEGRAARRILEDARTLLADMLGTEPDGVTFTSGGTEANDLVLGAAAGRPVLVGATEHASVLEAVPEAPRIPTGPDGLVDPAALAGLLDRHRPGLVSVMLVNNETGVVQDIPRLAAEIRAAGALLHVDAVQALGKLSDVNLRALDCDFLTVSAHKIGGPQGVGALAARAGLTVPARLRGGGQEGRRRAGTHNLPGIAGLAAAIRLLNPAEPARLLALRRRLEARLLAGLPDAAVAGAAASRAPHITALVLPGRPAELQVIRLDLAGIAVSAGAACSSGKVQASHVLQAMGLGPLAGCALRLSLGWSSTEAEVDRAADAILGLHRPAGTPAVVAPPLPNGMTVAT